MLEDLSWRCEALVAEEPFFGALGQLSRPALAEFLAHFDRLVAFFPRLVAAAVSRADHPLVRGTLAANLFEECGAGWPERAHHAIYRRFLASAAIAPAPRCAAAARWSETLYAYAVRANEAQVVGAIAAGELLAQPALSRVFASIGPQFAVCDLEYFTSHLALESAHVAEIGELLILLTTNTERRDIEAGFALALDEWRRYFAAAHHSLSSSSSTSIT